METAHATDVFRTQVLKGLIADAYEDVVAWFQTHGRALAFRLIVFALILVVSRFVAGIAKRLLTRTFRKRAKKSTLLQQMVEGLTVRTRLAPVRPSRAGR